MAEILWDPRLTALRVSVDRSGLDATKAHWRIVAAWVTLSGNWDDVPPWAKGWQRDTLGGDHHCYGRALFRDGAVAPQAGFLLSWPDGSDGRTPEADGWANIPIQAGYDPKVTAGPYRWAKWGNAEVLAGVGLPFTLPWATTGTLGGHHVSFFAVWQETEPEAPTPPEPEWKPYWLRLGPLTLKADLKAR